MVLQKSFRILIGVTEVFQDPDGVTEVFQDPHQCDRVLLILWWQWC